MNKSKTADSSSEALIAVVRIVFENIESKFVWMPLLLAILCVLFYPTTQMEIFPYLAILFIAIAFGADWYGRVQNRKTPPIPDPTATKYRDNFSNYRNDILRYQASVQQQAVSMLQQGKVAAARALTDKNLQAVDEALRAFPNDANFYALKGYTLKDMYQSSRNLLPAEKRHSYLQRARSCFEQALKLDPDNASAHNGMGNVLLFEGNLDDAIAEHEAAIELAGGACDDYPAACDDKQLVIAVREGNVPFVF